MLFHNKIKVYSMTLDDFEIGTTTYAKRPLQKVYDVQKTL